ncbi:hypothetical protein Pla123a_20880 [Posidoniimonas polymericola]|uniref:Tetratricopeptide repeat protein n=1 Tax=Posidoniimonas polymericola TaxID=2528002 RepID=A0A5C5YRU8_9BACT|nr:hypothetical protein [Posidoniimonas polymericola]TWT77427.1 hypothetical protein Pla123a_20880 [Posidoniimonas polymericola]
MLLGVFMLAAALGSVAARAELAGDRVVSLRRTAVDEQLRQRDNAWPNRDALSIELARQALLLTAREEFGLATRDGTFYEPLERDGEATFGVVLDIWHPGESELRIDRGGEELAAQTFTIEPAYAHTYGLLAAELEPRTRGELIELLEQCGYRPSPNRLVDTAPLAAETEDALLQMNHISQWRALRTIHGDIRESGESPERLGGLARGYANLSQLYSPLLDLRAQACRARALLYAERLRQRWPEHLGGRWSEAYTNVMIGLIQDGYEDVLEIRKQESSSSPGGDSSPAWAPLLTEYHKYKFDKLRDRFRDTDSPLSDLAGTLWCRAVQQSDCDHLTLAACREQLSDHPDELWMVDVLYEDSGVGFNHQVTAIMPAVHSQQIARWLPLVEGLPEMVAEELDGIEHAGAEMAAELPRVEIAEALIAAGEDDQQEPSLAVLGCGIEAWNALHAARRGLFVKHSLGMDASDEVRRLEPEITGYPLAPLIRTLALPPGSRADDYAGTVGDFTFVDAATIGAGYALMRKLPAAVKLQNMTVNQARGYQRWLRVQVEPDLHRAMTKWYAGKTQQQVFFTEQLAEVSRESPLLLTTNVRYRWDLFKNKVEKLAAQYPTYPSLNLAIAKGYEAQGDNDRALEFYQRYVDQAPDAVALRALANLYFKRGDEDQWFTTMNRIFDLEDYGLRQSRAASAIAATYMHQGRHDDALPWAERGSRSGAADPMQLYCECLTLHGRDHEAEQLAVYVTERYGMNYGHDDWYDWCARTGKGDLEAAWKRKQQRLANHGLEGTREQLVAETLHLLTTDQPAEARDMLAERFAQKFSPWDGMTLAMLYDQLDQPTERDAVLQTLAEHEPEDEKESPGFFVELAKVLQQAIATGEIDQPEVDRLVEQYREQGSGNLTGSFGIFLGRYAAHRDQQDRAIEYWKPAACYSNACWERQLAWKYLRDAGVNPAQVEGRHYRGEFWRDEPKEDEEAEEAGDSEQAVEPAGESE